MNYMTEVAKMLGVEIGEKFKCSNDYMYMFTSNGLIAVYDYPVPQELKEEDRYVNILIALLNGTLVILPKPWKPQKGEAFYTVAPIGVIESCVYTNGPGYCSLYKIGNCYKTKEEAEVNRDKWVEFYASDEVLEV